jgi:hypothetical protein
MVSEPQKAMTVSSGLTNPRTGRNNHGGGLNVPIVLTRHHVQ